MKLFLVITSRSENTVAWAERQRYVRQFCQEVEERLDDVSVKLTTYQDLRVTVHKGQVSIFDTDNQLDLKDADFVHFKNWTYELEDAGLISYYLDSHGIGYVNSEVSIALANGKISQMVRLAMNKLPVPDSFYARRRVLADIFMKDELPEGFTYPLIMKDNNGSKGDNNFLIKDSAQALEILEDDKNSKSEFILQNFIPNNGDYRVLFMGFDNQPLIFLRSAVAGSHLNNTSKGGSGSFVNADNISRPLVELARRAAICLRREVGGVDVLIDKNSKKPYILEVNGTPALATGFGLEEKVDKFTGFLKEQLETQEEE